MKGICLLIFTLFIASICAAQKTMRFDKIIITYARGGDTFGAPGVSSVGEIFELVSKSSASYKFVSYKKTKDSISPDSKRYLKDTTTIPLKKTLSKNRIDALFTALSTTKDNFTPEYIKPLLKRPSNAQIFADNMYIDKGYKLEIENKDDYDDVMREVNKMKRFDKIDSFINSSRPNPKLYFVVVDAWNGALISFIKNKDTIRFDMNRMKPLGQPIREYEKTQKKDSGQVVNVEANILLTQILPSSSMTRKELEINGFTDDYIKWYINNVL